MSLLNKAKHIVILGAGITGLTHAYALKKRLGDQIRITLIEKGECPGGCVKTVRINGFLFEQGPRSLRPRGSGVATLKLVQELGLANQVIVNDPQAKIRYIHQETSGQILRRMLWKPAVLKGIVRDLFASRTLPKDQSVASFFTDRFGKAFTEELIDPVLTGIYAGDIRQMSVRSSFPFSSGSLLKSMIFKKKKKIDDPFLREIQRSSIFTFKGGMEALPRALVNKLDAEMKYNCTAVSLREEQNAVHLTLSTGETVLCDEVVSALPAQAVAGILPEDLSVLLRQISPVSVALVNLGYHRKVLPRSGFGFLVPSALKRDILGVVFDSCVFPQHNQHPEETRLTVMMGGAHRQDLCQLPPDHLIQLAKRSLEDLWGISAEPDATSCLIVHQAIPQYHVGHGALLEQIDKVLKKHPRLHLIGNSYRGVSVNDCIANALICK
jgi:oxygen-dependent protoporphyrinogen oxidase